MNRTISIKRITKAYTKPLEDALQTAGAKAYYYNNYTNCGKLYKIVINNRIACFINYDNNTISIYRVFWHEINDFNKGDVLFMLRKIYNLPDLIQVPLSNTL